jgi:hypothetical protein
MVYSVRGRLMTGVSQINNQHAGMEIQYNLKVKLESQNTLLIKVGISLTLFNAFKALQSHGVEIYCI